MDKEDFLSGNLIISEQQQEAVLQAHSPQTLKSKGVKAEVSGSVSHFRWAAARTGSQAPH